MKTIQFKNGNTAPIMGLGTWKAQGNDVKDAVKKAIQIGYRHIDTAAIYQNESEIGVAIAESIADGVVSRNDLFVTSKLWNDAHRTEDVLPALHTSLEKLKLDYLDLYLIHWPVAFQPGISIPSVPGEYLSLKKAPLIDTWKEMIVAKNKGLAKHIGVSNFSKKKLEELMAETEVVPEMNQIELHPLLQQNELYNFCNSNGIKLTAYSPLGSRDRSDQMKAENEPNLMDLSVITDIAKKHKISAAKVLLGWHAIRGTAAIPKSTNESHLKANLEAAEVPLDKDDMENIAQLDKNYRFINGKFFEMPGSGYSNIYDE